MGIKTLTIAFMTLPPFNGNDGILDPTAHIIWYGYVRYILHTIDFTGKLVGKYSIPGSNGTNQLDEIKLIF